MDYDPKKLESHWQDVWSERGSFEAKPSKNNLPKRYILEMFPYPSGKIQWDMLGIILLVMSYLDIE